MSEALPPNLMSDVLNQPTTQTPRGLQRSDYRVHVSSLIRSSKNNEFCPRSFVLNYIENNRTSVEQLRPSMQLLFDAGNSMHETARNKWIENSPYKQMAFGNWSCRCGKTTVKASTKPFNALGKTLRCPDCHTLVNRYEELDLELTDYKITAHPDFAIKIAGKLLLVEIKTLDRADIDFDSIEAPFGDHTLQGSFYYWIMKELGYDLHDNVLYLYIDRSSKKLFKGEVYREFIVKPSPKNRLDVPKAKAMAVKHSIDSGKLPKKICDSMSCGRAKNCKQLVSCFSTQE